MTVIIYKLYHFYDTVNTTWSSKIIISLSTWINIGDGHIILSFLFFCFSWRLCCSWNWQTCLVFSALCPLAGEQDRRINRQRTTNSRTRWDLSQTSVWLLFQMRGKCFLKRSVDQSDSWQWKHKGNQMNSIRVVVNLLWLWL